MNPTLSPSLFRTAAPLLIVVAVAAVSARILNTELVLEPHLHRNAAETPDGRRVWPANVPTPMPTFSSNDRSRWATIRALVDEGKFSVGTRDPARSVFPAAVVPLAGSQCLDIGALLAATQARASLLQRANKLYGDDGVIFEDGWQSVDKVLKPAPEGGVREFYSSKPPLFTTMVAGLYWLLQKATGWTLEANPWGVVRTILLLVNGVPLAIYLVVLSRLIDRLGMTDWGKLFVLATASFGTFVTTFAMTLNNHTPAAYTTVFALAAAVPLWIDGNGPWWRFVVAGFFAALTACLDLPAAAFAGVLVLLLLIRHPRQTLVFALPVMLVPVVAWFLANYAAIGQWKPAYGEFGGPWYEYPGSHWLPDPSKPKFGIDWASEKESWGTYVLHFFVGHHGVFSLTPIWLLVIAGAVVGYGRERRQGSVWLLSGGPWARLSLLTLVVSVVVMAFYLFWQERWNYGGWTSGPRWLIWLTPLWLLLVLPAVDWMAQRRWARWLGYVLLGVSVFSAAYPAWNPWRHPWLLNWMETWGWVRY